jgi:hypothetical protein
MRIETKRIVCRYQASPARLDRESYGSVFLNRFGRICMCVYIVAFSFMINDHRAPDQLVYSIQLLKRST